MAKDPATYQPRVALWKQTDIRWSWKRLGKSKATMGPKGCAVTCLAMIILRDYWDRFKTNPSKIWRPGDVCDWMTANHRFTGDGQAYLNTVDVLTAGHARNVYHHPDGPHYEMVLLNWAGSSHWVLKLGTDEDDLCLDPWTGTIKQLHQPYWTVTTGRRWFQI